MAVTGGSFQCRCIADVIGWTSDEGMSFTQTAFQNPVPGSSCTTLDWLEFGGGLNSILNFTNVFFSCPAPAGHISPSTRASAPGLEGLLGSFSAANVWLQQVSVQVLAGTGTDAITTCGSIDSHSVFWGRLW
jgi:hypothetical protein